ncbi:hypothetical protein D3C72_1118140 [compost metagenome]
MIELDRVRILHRVAVVDAVHLGGLQDHLGADFGGAQAGGGVGGEVGVAGAGGEDDHAPLLEVAQRAAADEGLGHLADVHGREDAGGDTHALEAVLQGERVHHGRQHSHVVAGGAVHAHRARGHAAEDVAAAHHDGELDFHVHDVADLLRHLLDDRRIDAEAVVAHQRFTAQLQQHTLVLQDCHESSSNFPVDREKTKDQSLRPWSLVLAVWA